LSIYLDASVLIPSLIEEPRSAAVQTYLTAHPERLVSDFAAAEVTSAISRLLRMHLLDRADADTRLAEFDAWRTRTASVAELSATDARLASLYVRRFDLMLRAPDALHLAIVRRVDATLVTLDRRLARAAEELGVAFDVPGTATEETL